jgi:hypothetical protein
MTTVAFLSLFFGLIVGPYPFELAVTGPVRSVEILVDGKSVQRLQAPPWKAEADFGPDLQPHEIVARALDAEGHEVARAQEWANLPHPLTKVEIVLDEDKLGPPKAAKVVWTDLKGEKPRATLLTFDGIPLPLDSAGWTALPSHDLKSLHVLAAEVDFPSGRLARKEIAYGGEYGSEVSTELTAVPVRTRGGKLPAPERLGGWLTSGGRPLPVAAVEEGPAQLFVVRSPTAPGALWTMGARKRGGRVLQVSPLWDGMRLRDEDEVRIVIPFSQRFLGSGELSDLFTVLSGIHGRDYGLPMILLTARGPLPGTESRMRFADAVAVAGLEATTENRRRAVLLVLSPVEREQSRFDPERARRFLATLHVPLVVWCVGEPLPGSAAAAWGKKVEIIKGDRDLKRAYESLREVLDSQRIVMVDGRLLPQSIALSPKAAGVELVGATP